MASKESASKQVDNSGALPSADEPYWLGRASEEQKRLLKQHTIWTKAIGYLINPKILPKLPANAQIADIATGTGIWLADLAAISPSTYQFSGYDISPDQFLPKSSLLNNVTLDFIDFKQPIPAELEGKFDVVNVRLIIISMGPLDVWMATLKNLMKLVKPGGCITWAEGNFLSARGYRGTNPDSTPGHALTQAQLQFNASLRSRFGFWFPDFGQLFRDAGLKDVFEDVLSTDRNVEQREEVTQIAMGAIFGGLKNLSKVVKKEDGGWDEEEVERRRGEAMADAKSGAYLRWDIHVAIGWV